MNQLRLHLPPFSEKSGPMIPDTGTYDASTIEKQITAVVRAQFTLNH
ncbi:MAG: hypothetical protein M1343_12510 [Chloroflexi bacterium]|nr:hypothetical protein [Chloroflexota bacterium]